MRADRDERPPEDGDPGLPLLAAILASWLCMFVTLAALASQSPADLI